MGHTTNSSSPERQRRAGLNRRTFVAGSSALAGAGLLSGTVAAQNGTPAASPAASPVASPSASPVAGEVIRSISRAEHMAAVRTQFPLEEPAQTGGDVIQVHTTDVVTLNPIIRGDVAAAYVTGWIFDTLVDSSPIDGSPVPGLADAWELAADGVTYTFFINQNARWHDGTPLTADDVVFSFTAATDEDSLSPFRSSIVQGLQDFRKVDDHTFQLVSTEPIATFLYTTTMDVPIVAKHIWESVPFAQWGEDPGSSGQDPARVIGTGPFRFVERVQNSNVTLERNNDYWDPERLPIVDRYILRIVPDAQSSVQSLFTGESDFGGLSVNQVESIQETNPEINIVAYDTQTVTNYYHNQDPAESPLFAEIGVRQALQYALDRSLIADTIYQGYAVRADGTQPVLSPGYAPEAIDPVFTYDPERARQLLEEAGWVDTDGDGVREKDGVRFSFECMYSDSSASYGQLVPYMQQAWAEVGVELIAAAMPFPSLSDALDTPEFQMAIYTFTFGADGNQGYLYRCDAIEDGFNVMEYCNPEYDELDNRQRSELDPTRRAALLAEQSNLAHSEVATGGIVFNQSVVGANPRLHNFYANGYSLTWWLPYAWVEQ